MGYKTQRDVDRLALPPGVSDKFYFDYHFDLHCYREHRSQMRP